MEPRIEALQEKILVGLSTEMSLVENKTGEIWKAFRSRVNAVKHRTSEDFISLQVYPKGYFDVFNPAKRFTKWACVAVSVAEVVPVEMDVFTLPEGLYAVFHHKGVDISIFQYIYAEWIPNSKYNLADRPHFEVLGAKYKNNDPNSEEEIWIPIKEK